MAVADAAAGHDWPPRWVTAASLVLCVIGLGLAAYLTYAHYVDGNVLACPDSGAVNCAKVTSSSQSKVFGVLPLALLGLGYYIVLLALCLPVAWRASRPVVHQARLAAVIAGVGMVVYLVFAELFQIHAICLYCTGVHVVTVLLFGVVLYAGSPRLATAPKRW